MSGYLLEIEKIFTEVVYEVVNTITGISLESTQANDDKLCDNIVAMVHLTGEKKCMLLIDSNQETLRVLCSYITGLDIDAVTDSDLYDTLGEIVNMVAGNAKVRITNDKYKFSLSQPIVLTGFNIYLILKPGMSKISINFQSDELRLGMKIAYF